MASSGKTEKLGLSLWEAEDRPQRTDFREDNEKLEELVGGHLTNTAMHLTTNEKNFVRSPFAIMSYTGDGTKSRTFSYPSFRSPRLMLVFAKKAPPMKVVDGKACVYFAVGNSTLGASSGLTINFSNWLVSQQPVNENTAGYRYCLNESGREYGVVFIQ